MNWPETSDWSSLSFAYQNKSLIRPHTAIFKLISWSAQKIVFTFRKVLSYKQPWASKLLLRFKHMACYFFWSKLDENRGKIIWSLSIFESSSKSMNTMSESLILVRPILTAMHAFPNTVRRNLLYTIKQKGNIKININ